MLNASLRFYWMDKLTHITGSGRVLHKCMQNFKTGRRRPFSETWQLNELKEWPGSSNNSWKRSVLLGISAAGFSAGDWFWQWWRRVIVPVLVPWPQLSQGIAMSLHSHQNWRTGTSRREAVRLHLQCFKTALFFFGEVCGNDLLCGYTTKTLCCHTERRERDTKIKKDWISDPLTTGVCRGASQGPPESRAGVQDPAPPEQLIHQHQLIGGKWSGTY